MDSIFPPLHGALLNGDDTSIQTLLANPALNVNQTNMYGWTPLHCAAQTGNGRAVRALLEKIGIEVSVMDQNRQTALHIAACQGHFGVVEQLLSHAEVNVNIKNIYNWEPFHDAAHRGYLSIMPEHYQSYIVILKKLLKAGGDIGSASLQGHLFKWYVARNDDSVLSCFMIAGLNTLPDSETDYLEMIHEGARKERLKIIRMNLHAAVETLAKEKLTPLGVSHILRMLPFVLKKINRPIKRCHTQTSESPFWHYIHHVHHKKLSKKMVDGIVEKMMDRKQIEELPECLLLHDIYATFPQEVVDMIVENVQQKEQDTNNIIRCANRYEILYTDMKKIYFIFKNDIRAWELFCQRRFQKDWGVEPTLMPALTP